MKNTLVFFGSGPVAAESLRLLSESFEIEAVVTKPTTLQEMTTVTESKVYSVSNKSELNDLIHSKPFTSELAVLIDFGIIVSQEVIDYFSLGIINSHFSILPEWRGADPISFAILSGQAKTGVSLMLLDAGMDTGKILTTKGLVIDPHDTTPSLTHKLIRLSNELLIENIPKYITGKLTPRNQSHPHRATYSRKLTKEDGIIDWTKSAAVLEREIRAFIEWPKSRSIIGNKDVIITQAHAVPANNPYAQPGEIERSLLDQGILMIETGNGQLCIDTLKPAGKKEMPVKAFLAGYRQSI